MKEPYRDLEECNRIADAVPAEILAALRARFGNWVQPYMKLEDLERYERGEEITFEVPPDWREPDIRNFEKWRKKNTTGREP